jgi:WD40 repeat protein
MIGHKSPISGIDSTDDYVATAGYDNRIILWRRSDGEPLVISTHDHLANQCRFSPSGALLVTSSSDYTSRVWAVPGLELRAVLTDHTDDVEMSVISPDETQVATASRDHLVRVFDIDGTLRVRMEGHNADVLSVEWTEEGRELITSSDDGTVRRWDAATGRLLQTIDLGDVETDTIAPAGGCVIFAGNDEGQIVTIRPAGISKTDAHQAGVKRVIYDPRRRLLVTSSYDRTIRL